MYDEFSHFIKRIKYFAFTLLMILDKNAKYNVRFLNSIMLNKTNTKYQLMENIRHTTISVRVHLCSIEHISDFITNVDI